MPDVTERVVLVAWMRDNDFVGFDGNHRSRFISKDDIQRVQQERANDPKPFITMTLRQYKMLDSMQTD